MQYKRISIQDVCIKNRIRKNLGDIKSLAENIKILGLLSPIIINENNELLAGERRLEACKLLGWSDVDAIIINTLDKEHNISVEICENVNRQDFSMEELVNAGIELERIESIKADERMKSGKADPTKNSSEGGETRQIVAKKIGISFDTYRKNKYIVEHKDLLSPGEYADWNNRLISTNKAYNIIKKQLENPTQEETQKKLEDYSKKINKLKNENKTLTARLNAPVTIEQLDADEIDGIKAAIAEFNNNNEVKLNEAINSAHETVAELKKQVEVLQTDLLSKQSDIQSLKSERDKLQLQMESYRKEAQPNYNDCVDSDVIFNFCKQCVEFQNTVIAPIENGDAITQCATNNILYQRLFHTCKSMIDSLDRVIKKASVTDLAVVDDDVIVDF